MSYEQLLTTSESVYIMMFYSGIIWGFVIIALAAIMVIEEPNDNP